MVGGILPGIRSKLSQRAFSSLRRLAVHACIFIDFPRVRVGWRSPVTLHDGHPEPPRTSSSPVRIGFLRSLRAQLRAAPARASQSLSSIASVRVGFRTFGVSVRACSVVSRGCEQHNKKKHSPHTLTLTHRIVGRKILSFAYFLCQVFQAFSARDVLVFRLYKWNAIV